MLTGGAEGSQVDVVEVNVTGGEVGILLAGGILLVGESDGPFT